MRREKPRFRDIAYASLGKRHRPWHLRARIWIALRFAGPVYRARYYEVMFWADVHRGRRRMHAELMKPREQTLLGRISPPAPWDGGKMIWPWKEDE